ncbi:MAG: glycosyltransferase family 4 protein [Leptolyngbyaceae cyanobacterium bins.349]|nr:glycosyltransferase family 4 protein [Leptolyngbyaceae cyanobacterium bins.349]
MNLVNKRILVMTSVYPQTPNGHHGAFIRETVLRLQPLGIRFSIFAPAYEGSSSYELDGIPVYRFRYFWARYENLVRDGAPTKLQKQPLYLLVAFFYILLGTWQLWRVCRREKPDVLHVNWPFPHGLMALPVSWATGTPMVFSFHGAELLLANRFGWVSAVLQRLLPTAAAVTANSSFTRGLLSKLWDQPVTIIPYGLTIAAKAPQLRQAGEPPRLLFVGRLDERKGLRYLLAALPLVLAQQHVQLRVVGQGFLEPELKHQCQQLGLAESVQFLGFVTKAELANEYATCDIFVLPAIVDSKGDTEGLGIVMIEALAHEKPVIASQVGGIVDVITSGKTGLLVPEKQPTALAHAILDLLNHPEASQEMARNGFRDVQTRFSWQRIVPLWESVFADALSPKFAPDSSLPQKTL